MSHLARRAITRLAALLPCVLLTFAASASADQAHPMRFSHLTIDDGLSQSNVVAIHQDSAGFMWFGTENGLDRYDGYEFTHYRRERGTPGALANDYIFAIEEDSNGDLWIATNGGGLARWNRGSDSFDTWRHVPDSSTGPSSNVIRSLMVDPSGEIWIGTQGAGVDRFDPTTGQFTNIPLSAFGESASGTVFALHRSASGNVWVGGDFGVATVAAADGSVRFHGYAGSKPNFGVRAIVAAEAGAVWVGVKGEGLVKLSPEGRELATFASVEGNPHTLTDNGVSSVLIDQDGRLWVGADDGLNLVDSTTGLVTRYVSQRTDPSSLGSDDISTLFQDRTGLLWVGTRTRGLSVWNPVTWSYGFDNGSDLVADEARQPNVTAFVEDADGQLWIGTFGDGLNRVDRASGEVTRYRADDALSDDRVMSLMRDSTNRIWVGTMTRGIDIVEPGKGVVASFSNDPDDVSSLSANGIMALFEDSLGQVWIGTYGGGISRYDRASDAFTRFSANPEDSNSLSSNRVTSFAEDRFGRIWIGTDSGGLNLYDPETQRFHAFRHDPLDPTTLAADTIYTVNIDANGVVWVGTQGGGLDRVVADDVAPADIQFQNVSAADGLPNNVIYSAIPDAHGSLWLSSNFGLSRYWPATGDVRTLHRRDGLQSEEFNFGAWYRSDSGELFFGGHNGFNAFVPEEVRSNDVAPLIALTGFFGSGGKVKSDLPGDLSEGIDIDWNQDSIAFEFAALDFAAPELNQYQYKLEGFDESWIDLGTLRRVTYTDLDAGNFLLRVRAANSEGVWNDAGFALPVSVAAAPWATWWARLAYVSLLLNVAFGLWAAHRRRIRREEEYSQQLEQEVKARTEKLVEFNDELRSLNKALQESSLSDPLTGLRNRRFVFEEVGRQFDQGRRARNEAAGGDRREDAADLVFMMIDLDNFKPINDTYGHAAGDELLLELRDVLLSTCRRQEHVIRWGGDEFVIIAQQTRPDEAEALAERIRSTIAERNFTLSDGQIVRTTCSIGFAGYPMFRASQDESTLDHIINIADGLMYEAKKSRNAWVGMMGPNDARSSKELADEDISSTSMLFRVRRAGKLTVYDGALADDRRDRKAGA